MMWPWCDTVRWSAPKRNVDLHGSILIPVANTSTGDMYMTVPCQDAGCSLWPKCILVWSLPVYQLSITHRINYPRPLLPFLHNANEQNWKLEWPENKVTINASEEECWSVLDLFSPVSSLLPQVPTQRVVLLTHPRVPYALLTSECLAMETAMQTTSLLCRLSLLLAGLSLY